MKAMVLKEYGDNAEFTLEEISTPSLKAGHVLVKVSAVSVNTVDTMIRQLGQENLPLSPDLPAVLGMDFAGTIESIGEGVDQYSVGDEVFGCAGGLVGIQGSLAEYMLADSKLIAKKPKSLSMREAAALPLVGITAYEGLHRANVSAGKTVLVHGGVGGVGHVAVQLASHMGAEVFTTVSDDDAAGIVEGYGAVAINYLKESVEDYVAKHTHKAGFDVVFDTVGGTNIANSFEAAALNGEVATTVSLLELDLSLAHFKGLSLHVVFMLIPMLHDVKREEHGAILQNLSELVDSGALTPLLDESQFSFSEAGQAYDHLVSGKATGKVVITV